MFSIVIVPPRRSTLFPYTTLFRSPGDGSPIQLTIGRRRIRATAAHTYGNVARGGIAVVPGSDGLLEIAVREGSAAARLAMSLRSEEHTSELQSPDHLVCRLLLEKK